MAKYYAIIDVRIDDAEAYTNYTRQAKPMIEKHGGTYLVRGGALNVLEGDYIKPRRMVVLQFPGKEAFHNFYDSAEYQALRPPRLAASDMVMIGVEGYEG